MKRRATRKNNTRRRKTRRRRMNGGGFAYEIPANALVGYRSMDDSGTEVPRIMKMGDIEKNSERA
jgi:hypothetical protein